MLINWASNWPRPAAEGSTEAPHKDFRTWLTDGAWYLLPDGTRVRAVWYEGNQWRLIAAHEFMVSLPAQPLLAIVPDGTVYHCQRTPRSPSGYDLTFTLSDLTIDDLRPAAPLI
jgi:hypothetical protein